VGEREYRKWVRLGTSGKKGDWEVYIRTRIERAVGHTKYIHILFILKTQIKKRSTKPLSCAVYTPTKLATRTKTGVYRYNLVSTDGSNTCL